MSQIVEQLDWLVPPAGTVAKAGDELVRDVGVTQLKLNGRKVVGSILDAVQDVRVRHTIEGASTMTVTAKDPDKQLLESGLLNEKSTTTIDGLDFTLVKVGYSRSGLVTLEFESSVVHKLRQYKKPKKAVRGKVTRAQFARMLVREAKTIPFICPEVNAKQPIGTQKSKKGPGDPGFSRNEKFKVKGKQADAVQRRCLEAILDVGHKRRMPQKVQLAAVITVIQESIAGKLNRSTSGKHVGPFHQDRSYGSEATRMNPSKAANGFYNKAILKYRANPSRSVADLAEAVQISGNPAGYSQHVAEGNAILRAYNGGATTGTTATRKLSKRYEFTRGAPAGPKGEDTWAAITRLASEVQWRCFVQKRAVVFISENRLLATKPVLTLAPDHPAIDDMALDFDIGKPMAELPISVRIAQWDALQGDVISITGFGPANGRWLVREIEGSLFSLQRTVSLVKLTPKLPEPEAESEEAQGGGDAAEAGSATFDGKFRWPVTNHNLSSGFGPRGGRNHDGIDLPVPIGTPVFAAAAGTISFAGQQGGYGTCITIKHDGKTFTHYGHLSQIIKKNGSKVAAGDKIALSGNTGRSTGPHLHFEIRTPQAVDPMRYLK